MINSASIYLFSKKSTFWNQIAKRINSAKSIQLFLDYDGTLTPIRRTPSSAIISEETKNLIKKLAALPNIRIYIVTGRSLKDIRKLIPIKKIFFITNHGFHILLNGKQWIHPKAQLVSNKLNKLSYLLKRSIKSFEGSLVENKQYTLSIHYRQVPLKETPNLIRTALKTISEYDSKLVVTKGKKVIEVRPPVKWGKGNAVSKILEVNGKQNLAICIGDDETDEDVFKKVGTKAVTIRVGSNKNTHAKYYVKNVNEVLNLLRFILLIKSG